MQARPYHFRLLAPRRPESGSFGDVQVDGSAHIQLLMSAQRLRANAYLKDGAIQRSQVDHRGRYSMEHDYDSWHFLLVDDDEGVVGCARYRLHRVDVRFQELSLSSSPLARATDWSHRVRRAVESLLTSAREQNLGVAELGGWAIAEDYRHTKAALEILLSSYVWAETIGHCFSTCTATARNNSSGILSRIGGKPLVDGQVPLPRYFDPNYGCEMQLLQFDSRQLPSRFRPLADQNEDQGSNLQRNYSAFGRSGAYQRGSSGTPVGTQFLVCRAPSAIYKTACSSVDSLIP